MAATLFKDPNFRITLVDYANFRKEFSAEYSGYQPDYIELMKQFKKIRTRLDEALIFFRQSGGGEAGLETPKNTTDGCVVTDEEAEEEAPPAETSPPETAPAETSKKGLMDEQVFTWNKYSSNFWQFCNGDNLMHYFFVALMKNQSGLLRSACSQMTPELRGGSDYPDAGYTKRPRRSSSESADASEARGESVINLVQTEDERDLVRERLKVARIRSFVEEASAATQMDAAIVSLAEGLDAAQAKLQQYENSTTFIEGSFLHGVYKGRIADLTAQIERTQAKWAKLHK